MEKRLRIIEVLSSLGTETNGMGLSETTFLSRIPERTTNMSKNGDGNVYSETSRGLRLPTN